MPRTHKALYLESKHGSFVLRENETPKPDPGQALVKIQATGLNPVDWKIREYGAFVEEYPAIIGTDIAGVVEEVGEGVTKFKKGDRIFYQGEWTFQKAGYQQYNVVDVEVAAKIPDNVSFDQAATVTVALTAAYIGLYNDKPHAAGHPLPLEPSARGQDAGKPLVVLGGATSVGQYVIQLGRLSGFSPIVTTASPKHEEYLKSLGATHVVDRSTPSLVDAVSKITAAPIETVFDAVSLPETQNAGYKLVAPGGHLLVVLPPTVENASSDRQIYYVFGVLTLPYTRAIGIKLYDKLTELLADGSIKPNKVEVVPGGLNGVVPGLERLQANKVSGTKLVVHPQETP